MINGEVVVTQAELDALYKAPNAKVWWEMRVKLLDRISDLFLSHGVIFHWITPEGLHHPLAGYCSLTWEIAELVGLGQGTEYKKGDWHPMAKFGKKIYDWGVKNKKQYIIKSPLKDLSTMASMIIVSPNSKAAQEFIKEVTIVQLPYQDFKTRVKNDWAIYQPLSKKWDAVVREEGGPLVQKFFEELKIKAYDMFALTEKMEHNLHSRAGMMLAIVTTLREILEKEDKEVSKRLLLDLKALVVEGAKESHEVNKANDELRLKQTENSGALRCNAIFGT